MSSAPTETKYSGGDKTVSLRATKYTDSALGDVWFPHLINHPAHRQKLHDGFMFGITHKVTLASAGNIKILITTPNPTPTTRQHMLYSVSGTGLGELNISKNPTGTVEVTPLTVYNLDWSSSNTSNVTAKIVSAGTPYSAGTIRPPGYKIFGSAQKAGGTASAEDEFMVGSGASALYDITSGANNNIITINITWHSGEDAP